MSHPNMQVTGIAERDFSEDVWRRIAGAYVRSAFLLSDDEPVTPDMWLNHDAVAALRSSEGFRIGSIITNQSKLLICGETPGMLHFDFLDNAEDAEKATAKKGIAVTSEEIQNEFRERVGTLLSQLHVAQEFRCMTAIEF